jgi:hypothetical protein
MRLAPLLLLVTLLSGCDDRDPCRALTVGMSIEGLEKSPINSLYSMGNATSRSRGAPTDFDEGPVDAHLCCFSKELGSPHDWCSPEQLECTAPEFQGVTIFTLQYPYSVAYGNDAGYFCVVAAKDNRILAIWNRHWS